MTSYWKEKYTRNIFLALVACMASLTLPANAQDIVPPGVYGYGWGDQPYWLKPSFDYSYELNQAPAYERNETYPYHGKICFNEKWPVYSRSAPHRYLGVKSAYVCRPDNAFMNTRYY